MVYMYHSFLVHSSADGHLGCFHILAMINIKSIGSSHMDFGLPDHKWSDLPCSRMILMIIVNFLLSVLMKQSKDVTLTRNKFWFLKDSLFWIASLGLTLKCVCTNLKMNIAVRFKEGWWLLGERSIQDENVLSIPLKVREKIHITMYWKSKYQISLACPPSKTHPLIESASLRFCCKLAVSKCWNTVGHIFALGLHVINRLVVPIRWSRLQKGFVAFLTVSLWHHYDKWSTRLFTVRRTLLFSEVCRWGQSFTRLSCAISFSSLKVYFILLGANL